MGLERKRLMGDIHYLHRGGFPPLDPATIGKAMRDGRAYRRTVRPAPPELHKQVADLDAWLNRGAGFDPPVRWAEWLFVCLVFGAIIFGAAVLA